MKELRQAKYADVIGDNPNITFIKGRARFLDARTVATDTVRLKANAILIATGARPCLPPLASLDKVNYLTNETVFDLEALLESLLVLGGRYIAIECAQMFARMGSKVTVLQRSERILPDETPDLTDALTGYLRDEGLEIVTGVKLWRITQEDGQVVVEAQVNGAPRAFRAAHAVWLTSMPPSIGQGRWRRDRREATLRRCEVQMICVSPVPPDASPNCQAPASQSQEHRRGRMHIKE